MLPLARCIVFLRSGGMAAVGGSSEVGQFCLPEMVVDLTYTQPPLERATASCPGATALSRSAA